MTLLFSLASAIFSGLCLAILMLSDRKRSSRHQPFLSLSAALRKILGVLWLLPIVLLCVFGQFSALLVWLGAVTIVGWLLAVAPQKQ